MQNLWALKIHPAMLVRVSLKFLFNCGNSLLLYLVFLVLLVSLFVFIHLPVQTFS